MSIVHIIVATCTSTVVTLAHVIRDIYSCSNSDKIVHCLSVTMAGSLMQGCVSNLYNMLTVINTSHVQTETITYIQLVYMRTGCRLEH